MATASDSSENDGYETDCPVCHDSYQEPKLLPCTHLLCHRCLVTWLRHQASCPLCRCAIADLMERSYKSCEEIAQALHTDASMASLVKCVQTLSEDHVCYRHADEPASSLCLNCEAMLCDHCAEKHRAEPFTQNHELEDASTITPERMSARIPSHCSVHSDKPGDFYCQGHKVIVCHCCAIAKHRACPDVTRLEVKVAEACAALAEMSQTLQKGERDLARVIRQLDQELALAEKRSQEAIQEIEEACSRLEEAVQACKLRLTELQQEKHSETKDLIHKLKTMLLHRRGSFTLHRHLVERVDRTSSHKDLLIMRNVLETLLNKLDPKAVLPTQEITSTVLTIDQDAVLRAERELYSLGKTREIATEIVNHLHEAEEQPEDTKETTCQDGYSSSVQLQIIPNGFRFHRKCGKNVNLSNDLQTASFLKKSDSFYDGITISSVPMAVNCLYEVKVEETYSHTGLMYIGVVCDRPDNLTLPSHAGRWRYAVVVGPRTVSVYGKETQSKVGHSLRKLSTGSRVGVLVDAAKCLHLYMNGRDQGIVAPVLDPSYPFFELFWDEVNKVTSLPVASCT